MSGTSLDGVSTALVRLQADPPAATLVAFRQEPYGAAERGAIIDAMARGTPRDLAFLHVALGERFAGAVLSLLAEARVAPRDLAFIASHGQTVWHEPGKATLQLGDAAVLAERLGVRVVSDFRARDVAAGGQGAPLVPLADVMLFGHEERGRLLLNIGGMANFTWVPRRGVTEGALAFDTGPGVAVIDAVTRRVDPDAAYDVGVSGRGAGGRRRSCSRSCWRIRISIRRRPRARGASGSVSSMRTGCWRGCGAAGGAPTTMPSRPRRRSRWNRSPVRSPAGLGRTESW